MSSLHLVRADQPDANPLRAHPTDVPCPSWCRRAAGHPYRYALLDEHEDPAQDRYHRVHSCELTDLTGWDLGLSLSQLETASAPDGADLRRGPLDVFLEAPHCGAEIGRELPAAELRVIASRLLDAAAILQAMMDDPAQGSSFGSDR